MPYVTTNYKIVFYNPGSYLMKGTKLECESFIADANLDDLSQAVRQYVFVDQSGTKNENAFSREHEQKIKAQDARNRQRRRKK